MHFFWAPLGVSYVKPLPTTVLLTFLRSHFVSFPLTNHSPCVTLQWPAASVSSGSFYICKSSGSSPRHTEPETLEGGDQGPGFNKPSRGFWCLIKFENQAADEGERDSQGVSPGSIFSELVSAPWWGRKLCCEQPSWAGGRKSEHLDHVGTWEGLGVCVGGGQVGNDGSPVLGTLWGAHQEHCLTQWQAQLCHML